MTYKNLILVYILNNRCMKNCFIFEDKLIEAKMR